MGVRLSSRSFFVLLWVYFYVIRSASAETICDIQGCNCTVKVASWKTINCTLRDGQELKLDLLRIPDEADEIFITGGDQIVFGPKSFDRIPGITLLRIEGTRKLVMEKQSFRNLTTPSLIIQIQNCDDLNIKTGAFENVQSSVEFEITRCGSVNVEKTAFSKLKHAIFKEIPKLILATETFELKNQGHFGRHGPVTTIIFDNVTISTIPYRAFFSALAEVKIHKSTIGEIQNEAFSPTEISSLSIIHTNINHIHSKAFAKRTLIYDFRIEKCTIKKIGEKAIEGSMANLTVKHSKITDIHSGAINSTVAKVDISSNEIGNLQSASLVFNGWNRINLEENMIEFLHTNFLIAPVNNDVVEFSFKDNVVYKFDKGALSFVPDLEDRVFIYEDNFFEQTCHCLFDEWIVELITANITSKIDKMLKNTFCRVNDLLSQCFELKVGVINVHNFTELVCTDSKIVCEPYRGETKVVNGTNKMLTENDLPMTTDWLSVIIGTSAFLVLLVIIIATIMLVRGSRWLKRKGYFKKIHYNQNEHSNDEENTVETVDDGDKLDISEDLTMELLQDLSKKLDDPMTHQEASEMIEQLYQKYIHNTGLENNNHDDETHLYEELGNLQANGINHDPNKEQQNGPRSILRLMEEKFNTQFEDIDAEEHRPPLVGEYSEPSDAAVHLYSEVKQNNKDSEGETRDSLKSRASSNMAFRPLPDKPGSSRM